MFQEGKSHFRAMQKRGKRSRRLVYGAYAHGPFCGITSRMLCHPMCVKYINQFLSKHLPKGVTWSTFAITKQLRATIHTDSRNLHGSTNCAFSLGQTKDGGLYVQDEGGDRSIKTKQGATIKAKLYDNRRNPICFSPKFNHAVQAWSGVRLSVACYTTRSVFQLSQNDQRTLQQHCFKLPKLHNTACGILPPPHNEGGIIDAPPIRFPFLREGKIQGFSTRKLVLSSCPVFGLAPKPPRDILYAAPAMKASCLCAYSAESFQDSLARRAPSAIGSDIMAANPAPNANIRCDTQYLAVDCSQPPNREIRRNMAVDLLYRGGLAAERLNLGNEDFFAATQRLYAQVPIQVIANSSFNVPVPNLVALTELHDYGLGQLRNRVAPQGEGLDLGDGLHVRSPVQRSRPNHSLRHVPGD